jgi:hypothetical protein
MGIEGVSLSAITRLAYCAPATGHRGVCHHHWGTLPVLSTVQRMSDLTDQLVAALAPEKIPASDLEIRHEKGHLMSVWLLCD